MVHAVSHVGAAVPVCGFPHRGSERQMSCVHTAVKKGLFLEEANHALHADRSALVPATPSPEGRAWRQPLLRETRLGHPFPTGSPAQYLVAIAHWTRIRHLAKDQPVRVRVGRLRGGLALTLCSERHDGDSAAWICN